MNLENLSYTQIHDQFLKNMSKYKEPSNILKIMQINELILKKSRIGKNSIKVKRKLIKYNTLKVLDLKGFKLKLKRNLIVISW